MQLHYFFEKSVDEYPSNTALVCDGLVLSYQDLEWRANRLAHYLAEQKVGVGSVVAVLLERSLESYLSLLALLKIGAVYVPIEVEYPDERINLILGTLEFQAVLTSASQAARKGLDLPRAIVLDQVQMEIATKPSYRPIVAFQGTQGQNLCYIIYTSGSTGKPKGVEIRHTSICHYVAQASVVYSMQSEDKVYQGFSLAFDASMEEIWMAFANGAALIACTDKDIRTGLGLLDFLQDHEVSVFSTVPTLLSSLEPKAHSLRLLILGGEVCTAALIKPWIRSDLRVINTYGPTEATVIATYVECKPDKEVSIGKPLTGYEVLIVDEQLQPTPDGVVGELCIGGEGLARGYVQLPEFTQTKFVPHPQDPSQRIYRTGDMAYRMLDGNFQFSGRIDEQIKLRGFRIELNEIESVIMQHSAVSQAVVVLQNLNQPTLVAYLLLNKNTRWDLEEFKSFLQRQLPDYMMPHLFEQVLSFPLLASGKVNRKELPKPRQLFTQNAYVSPGSLMEKQMAEIWEASLKQGPISATADFFYDLGGHSLLAAKVISNLRKLEGFETVSVLDLYQNPTIRQLAVKVAQAALKPKVQESRKDAGKKPVNLLSYYFCGIGQFFGCLLQYGLSVWPFLIFILCYTRLLERESLFSLESLVLYLTFFLATPLISGLFIVTAKWLLLGRVKPGHYPLWGWFYFRWWLVQGLQNNFFQMKYMASTPLINLYYRLLGAKIGAHCFIATINIAVPDLFTLGDESTLSNEVQALGYIVEDGWLKIGSINIGKSCYVGARSILDINTIMEDNAVLDDMSLLPRGECIEQSQYCSGSPAVQSALPEGHITVQQRAVQSNRIQVINYSLLHYFAVVFVLMLHYASFLPSAVLLNYFYLNDSYWVSIFIGAPLAAVLLLITQYASVILSKRLILNKALPGTHSIYSFYYLRQSVLLKILDADAIGVLADSLFFPMLLRFLGAKIGKKVEMGEAPQVMPDFVTMEEGSFSASGVGIAWPMVYRGYMVCGKAQVGEHAFIGNVSFLPQGTAIGKECLLGCMTIPPANNQAVKPNSYWLGSPPIYLPNREVMGGFSDELTYNPSKALYSLRVILELFRIVLPSTCSLILICTVFYSIEYLMANYSLLFTALVLPLVECGMNLIIVAALIALKWGLVGRIKPCVKPLWDVFIWKNDIREFTYGYYINPHLTELILGTPFIGYLFRSMGAKIGKRVFINTESFAEFDLIQIGDEVCINKDSLIQTHLYEDRIFKLDNLAIKEGCNVGVGSMVLYNTVMEPHSTLGSFSLLMKGETLLANTCWEGNPAQTSYAADPVQTREDLVAGTVLQV